LTWEFTVAFTTAVACLPAEKTQTGRTIRTAKMSEVKQCAPRLDRFVRFADPRFVVFVGRVAEAGSKFLPTIAALRKAKTGQLSLFDDGPKPRLSDVVSIQHPNVILSMERQNEKAAARIRMRATLREMLEVPF
jgi:uracil-DNA glycosylase